MKDKFKDKAVEVAKRYLERKGYLVCAVRSCYFDLIATEKDGPIVFVDVSYAFDSLPSEQDVDMHHIEDRIAKALLMLDPEADTALRYDNISIAILSKERALLRHHINAIEGMPCK